jgi:hypothetical protein
MGLSLREDSMTLRAYAMGLREHSQQLLGQTRVQQGNDTTI